MAEKVVIIEDISCRCSILENLKFSFGSFSVVQLIVIASLEVDTYYGVGMQAQVHSENIQADIIIVHLIVAKSDIDVDSMEILVLNQEFLIDLSCLLKVASEIVKCSHAQLVFY